MDELVKDLRKKAEFLAAAGHLAETMKQAADAIEELSREYESLAKTAQEASEALRQRRPVVLCRDCVHFTAHSGTGSGYCGFLDIGTIQESFCSNGEKEG